MTTPTIPAPADAVTVYPWESRPTFAASHGQPYRDFRGSSWRVPVESTEQTRWHVGPTNFEIVVEILGLQLSDGSVRRWVNAYTTPTSREIALPPAAARMLSESLADAYAEIERYDDGAPITDALPLPTGNAVIVTNQPGMFPDTPADEWPYVALVPGQEPNGMGSLEVAENHVRATWVGEGRGVEYR